MSLLRRLLLAVLLMCAALPAIAQTDDVFAGLASDNFDDIGQAITALALSGDKQAGPTIRALQNDALYAAPDGTLLIKDDAAYRNARTGEVMADVVEDDLVAVKVNNRVRRATEAALGSLDLFADAPAVRRKAAQAVFTSRDPAILPALARALAQEKDSNVARVMREAQAASVLASPEAPEADRLAAIAVMRTRGDLEAQSVLASLQNQSPAVTEAAKTAISGMASTQQLWSVVQSIVYGLSLGSVLLLAAAGLAITFGVMGVINMAHGEMVMLGAYTTFVVQEVIRAYAPGLFGASLFFAVPLAFLVSGGIGILIERGMIRFLYGRPLETLLATWGLSLVLQQAVRSAFGANNRDVGTPAWMSGATQWGGVTVTYNRLTIVIFAFMVLAALMAVLRYTALGLRMRAVTQNRRMAAAMGIRTPWIDALTFGLGSGIAGMAGVALSQIDNVSPNLGQSYIIDSFMVVVFGGVGNLWGTLVSALTLGIVNKFLEPVAGAVLGKIVVLVLLILFIQRKPRGMFPLKGRAVEA